MTAGPRFLDQGLVAADIDLRLRNVAHVDQNACNGAVCAKDK